MKKVPAIIAVLLSIPFFTLGLLFLIAAGQAPGRVLVALAMLAVGALLLVVGLRRLRRLAELSPSALQTGAIELAKRLGGEVTVSQFRAEYRLTEEQATSTLDALVRSGAARPDQRDGRVVYVVSGLAPGVVQKVCPYCGTELPVRTALRKCPNCGGLLEITKT